MTPLARGAEPILDRTVGSRRFDAIVVGDGPDRAGDTKLSVTFRFDRARSIQPYIKHEHVEMKPYSPGMENDSMVQLFKYRRHQIGRTLGSRTRKRQFIEYIELMVRDSRDSGYPVRSHQNGGAHPHWRGSIGTSGCWQDGRNSERIPGTFRHRSHASGDGTVTRRGETVDRHGGEPR